MIICAVLQQPRSELANQPVAGESRQDLAREHRTEPERAIRGRAEPAKLLDLRTGAEHARPAVDTEHVHVQDLSRSTGRLGHEASKASQVAGMDGNGELLAELARECSGRVL